MGKRAAVVRPPAVADMSRCFVTYFTLKGAWRSCDVKELGGYQSERDAMLAGQRHAVQHAPEEISATQRLVWKRVPMGLAAPTGFGRYDIREAPLSDRK